MSDCPRFGLNMHRSRIGKTGIVYFSCKTDPGKPSHPPHYAYRGPHGEVAAPILTNGEVHGGRFRYTSRITSKVVETEYNPLDPQRRAAISAVVTESWKNPETRNRHILGMTKPGVQAQKAAALKATVAKRKEEIAELRKMASHRQTGAGRNLGRPKKAMPEFVIFGEQWEQIISRFTKGKQLAPQGIAKLRGGGFADIEIECIMNSRNAKTAAIHWICRKEEMSFQTGKNYLSQFLALKKRPISERTQ
jgi:hypothetical protein